MAVWRVRRPAGGPVTGTGSLRGSSFRLPCKRTTASSRLTFQLSSSLCRSPTNRFSATFLQSLPLHAPSRSFSSLERCLYHRCSSSSRSLLVSSSPSSSSSSSGLLLGLNRYRQSIDTFTRYLVPKEKDRYLLYSSKLRHPNFA